MSAIIMHPQKSLLGRIVYNHRSNTRICLGMNSLKTLLIWTNAFFGSFSDKQEPLRLFIWHTETFLLVETYALTALTESINTHAFSAVNLKLNISTAQDSAELTLCLSICKVSTGKLG